MKCPNCGKELPDYAQACGFCGTKLEAKNTCPQCGKELPADALACGYCGAKLGQPAAKAPKAAPAARPAPAKAEPGPSLLSGLPKWALPAGIVALVVVVILFFVLLPGPGEEVSILVLECEEPIYISVHDSVYLYSVWTAETEAQMEDYLNSYEYVLNLDGKEFGFEYNSDIYSDIYEDEEFYLVDHEVFIGQLEEGTHHLESRLWFKNAIWDGTNEWGPGTEFKEAYFTCEIIVE